MPSLRNSLNIRSRVMWVRAFFNTYKRRVIAAGGVIQNEACAVRSLNNNLLRSASWTLVPSGIEEDIVFAQKPTSGLGDLTYTRASDATYTDASGVVRRSPYNLLTFSEMFTDASWVKTSSTITANTISAPNGTLTADTLTASSSFPRVVQNPTIQANQSYRISTYAKAGSASVFTIFVSVNAVTLVNNVQYNLSTGVVTGSGTMQDVGNGWYLCSATFTVGASTASPDIRFFNHAQGITGGWSGSNFFYAWGAQLVEGTEALDYFPTTNRQDVPRIDFRNADGTLSSCGRLLLEPQRTNSIRNSSMVGAVAGTPGTLPTNWATALSGLTRTIVGIGTENGLPYIDLRFNGTATGTNVQVQFDALISASASQVWTNSFYLKTVSITNAPNSYALNITELDSSGNFLTLGTQVFTPTLTLNRYTFTRTLANASVARLVAMVQFNLTNGVAYDFTIRIAAPQMELGAYATTWVPTTTAAVTRLADAASKTGVSSLIGQTEGTVFLDLNYQAITGLSMFLSIRPNATNKIEVYRDGTSIFGDVIGNGVNVLLSRVSNPAGQYKIALSYKSGQTALYINGASVGTSSTAFSFATSMADLFLNLRSGPTFVEQTFYNQAALFPTRLTNAELAQLTTL